MNVSSINMFKPFSPACERNQDPILASIKPILRNAKHVLEIGSGTGQHGVHFAKNMPWIKWQCSDVRSNLPGIQSWIESTNLENLFTPLELDVSVNTLNLQYDAIYSCNTLHIMSKQQVGDFFNLIATGAKRSCDLIIYGPFNYLGKYTANSNAEFDLWLKNQNPQSGIRDFEWIDSLAMSNEFVLVSDKAMPANNRLLHWHRTSTVNL